MGKSKVKIPPHTETTIAPDARVIFFSDAHLEFEHSAEGRPNSKRVAAFLDYLHGKADMLVILGDLFDFYFEYKSVFPARYLRVLAGIQALSDSGVSCYYVAGNHDFWLGELFSNTLGVKLVADSLILNRESNPAERVLAAHGDGFGQGDLGYEILKKILRNSLLIRLFRLLHPDWGYALARITSRASRKYTLNHQAGRIKACAEVAQSLLAAYEDLDTVILAHTHSPEQRQFDRGRYLNVGDWLTHFSYIVWSAPGEYELKSFDYPSRQGCPPSR